MSNSEVKSICGAVKFIAAVFRQDPEELKAKYGLPTKAKAKELKHTRVCQSCGNLFVNTQGDSKVCPDCRVVEVVCDECGRLFPRNQNDLLWRFQRGYRHAFCNLRCFGAYIGKHYGFKRKEELDEE